MKPLVIRSRIDLLLVFRRFFLLSTIFLVLHICGQIGIYFFGASRDWLGVLNMDHEYNLPTLFSASLMAASGCLLRLLSDYKESRLRNDFIWFSWIMYFVAFDELFQVHEILIIPSLWSYLPPALYSTWVIPYSFAALFVLIRLRLLLLSLSAVHRRAFLVSALVFVSGAIGMEVVASFLVRTHLISMHSFYYGFIAGVEEYLEMLGVIFFLRSLTRLLLSYCGRVSVELSI